jgi:tripartite-type tricarboxylate transporter receptor subunit TctC
MASPVQATGTYPVRPVKIIVPFAAAGAADILARSVASVLNQKTGQAFVVENHAGASGNIGAQLVAKAAPDGYTLLFTTTNLTMNPALGEALPYDPVRDFTPVTMVAFAPMILVKSSQVKAATVPDLVAEIRSHPTQYNFSSSGVGGAPHLAGELFRLKEDLKVTHVPYNGAAPALNDVASGQVQYSFTTYVSAQSFLQGDRVLPMAVTSTKRLPSLPKVPTFEEAGIKEMEIGTMFGLLAPANTPSEVVQVLYQTLSEAGKTPQFQQQIKTLGADIVLNTPSDYTSYIRTDVGKWKELLSKIGKIN